MMVKPKKRRKQRGSYFNFFFMVLVFSKLKGELYLLGVLCVKTFDSTINRIIGMRNLKQKQKNKT